MNLDADLRAAIADLQDLQARLAKLNSPEPTSNWFYFETDLCPERLTVHYSYEPAERETGPSYSCAGTPAIDASVDLQAVYLRGVDVLGLLASDLYEEIEQAAFKDAEDWDE